MITSSSNNRIKALVQLNQKAKARKEQDVFLVEGIKMFLEAPLDRIRDVYVSESFFVKQENREFDSANVVMENRAPLLSCMEKLQALNYEIVSDDVFEKISDTKTPQGILCVVQQYHYKLEELIDKKDALLVILEDLQDPGNMGTIMRTGEGAGISGIILSKDCVDIYNPKTIRATMGSVYRVPFIYVEELADVLKLLKDKQIKTFAAHLDGKEYYDNMNFKESTAFLIGNEGNGLKEQTAKAADSYIKIPMEGKVESLNAAVAASLLIYEASRQRRIKQ